MARVMTQLDQLPRSARIRAYDTAAKTRVRYVALVSGHPFSVFTKNGHPQSPATLNEQELPPSATRRRRSLPSQNESLPASGLLRDLRACEVETR